jgi:peroxiredoxin
MDKKLINILVIWLVFFGVILITLPIVSTLPIRMETRTAQQPAKTAEVAEVGCKIGNEAPDFTLNTVKGVPTSLKDFRGKSVILNFGATWCGPCQYELPFLQSVYYERSGKGVEVLGIDIRESKELVQDFFASTGVTFNVLLDQDAVVARKFCLTGPIPITFFINSDGIIKARKIGAFQSQKEIENILNTL